MNLSDKTFIWVIAVILSTLFNWSCSSDKANETMRYDGSLLEAREILRNRQKFTGQTIKVRGLFSCEFEDVALYPTDGTSDQHKSSLNGIWVEGISGGCESFDSKIVVVVGKFNGYDSGNQGAYAGTLNAFTIAIEN